ncbi:MAG: TrkH family potassium uptake protein [Endomicrobiia bacterium]
MKLYPYKVIILFFIILIFIGTLLLMLPISTKNNISLIDRIFTASSAVCVTGLTTVDITTNYTFLGQLFILLLIQIGALGYMLLGSIIIILFGRINLMQKKVIGESLNVSDIADMKQISVLIKNVIFFTFLFEFFGFIILFLKFYIKENFGLLKSLWYGVFHAVSAFCNAGFSLFSNNFENYHSDLVINLVIPILIISGGLGFIVWMDILQKVLKKKENFLLHSKIVFLMSIILSLGGSVLIFLLNQKIFKLQNLSFKTQILVSWFQSITSRTAGFNTFPISQMSTLTIILIIFLMFIGASPGGTAGGIKTTTFFVIISSIYNYIIGEKEVSAFKRRININVVLKSFSIFFICFFWVILISSAIFLLNKFSFKECFFETVSAFATVGLSLGITQYVDNISKILLIITMLVGRVGSLALVSLILTKEPKEIKYLEEPIAVG